MTDRGFTHIAIECTNLDNSIEFYARYGDFEVVHRRESVAWISDRTRPFAIVLIEAEHVHPLGPLPHLGFACGSRESYDRLLEQARTDGCLRDGTQEGTGPAGTWAFIDDPDGNTFEISIGQSVEFAVLAADSDVGPHRLRIICVIGSGIEAHEKLAEPLGEAVARSGAHLLTGGGGGTMTAVARGYTFTHPRAGLSIGILRGTPDGDRAIGYPNAFIEIPIATHLSLSGDDGRKPLSRNHLTVLTPDAIIALPGGAGTESEIALAMRYNTPIIVHESWETAWKNSATWCEIGDVVDWLQTYC
jgi:uncharacterized protein (TIGR00725 family)